MRAINGVFLNVKGILSDQRFCGVTHQGIVSGNGHGGIAPFEKDSEISMGHQP